MGVQIRVMGDDREEVELAMTVLTDAVNGDGRAVLISNGTMLPNRRGPGGRMTGSMEVGASYRRHPHG